MRWRDVLSVFPRRPTDRPAPTSPVLEIEPLESRTLLDATAVLAGTVLTITGGPNRDRIDVLLDPLTNHVLVQDAGRTTAQFASSAVTSIVVDALAGDDYVTIAPNVLQPATLNGGPGDDVLHAGGGPTTLDGGPGNNKLIGGRSNDTLNGGAGVDLLYDRRGANLLNGGLGPNTLLLGISDNVGTMAPANKVFSDLSDVPAACDALLTANDVQSLLLRASAATPSEDGIIAIVDRNGTILGVRVEGGVNTADLNFAIDGAVAKARTGAFFASNAAPLTSRTVEFISQSSITEREVNSDPSITNQASTLRGPGFVAPIGVKSHFPPNVMFTPQVDLLYIEHTNRDSYLNPGPDTVKGTPDDIPLPTRFNATFAPGKDIPAPLSYGDSLLTAVQQRDPTIPHDQARGIGTLPGGIPIYKNGCLVGGIGVFYPGRTGFASEENSVLNSNYDPSKPDRSLEAEYVAFATVGGSKAAGYPIGALGSVPALPGFDLPFGRIDLVGITLDIYGPGGLQGPRNLVNFGLALGIGKPSGVDVPVNSAGAQFLAGQAVPDGWLVQPKDGVNISTEDVIRMVAQGIAEANDTRAAIRLPLGSRTRMVFAVTDQTGEVLGLYRMPDATFFSIDVAVAKARNVAYYADANQLQPPDRVPGVAPGMAFTNRTFRYLAQPRFPEGIDGSAPGPFSILNDGGSNFLTGLNTGAPLPASAFQSVVGYDAFHPGTNFRQDTNLADQNGIVFFPGSSPVYKYIDGSGTARLVGGLGISGDGVDQDDVVTFGASMGYQAHPLLRADQVLFNGVRLPYQKFNRNPRG